ncbi:MAG: DUF3857 domain-containing protein [Sphingobacteriales bacterium]|nr:MAG: DUF3857 domain-containing protein [Sphingobacteriales bacterium]
MRVILLLMLFAVASKNILATDGSYAFNKIKPELLKGAHVVKRFEEIRFSVKSIKKAILYHKYAFTVLNEQGDIYARLLEGYDKIHSIESIEGSLYDANGTKIKSLKKNEIQDRSGTDDNNLADDSRVKYHNFYHKVYPYTVEYEFETEYNGTLFFPIWLPIDNEHVAVEYSSFKLICATDYVFRHKALNYREAPKESIERGDKVYTWEVNNFMAIKDEYASPYWLEMTPVVFLGPNQFEMQDYEGNMSNWQDFGKFFHTLKSGRDQLPDQVKQKVHELTDGLKTPEKKTETLYKYMQDNTRYISIQLGIGGWQPFDASYVANKKYGDCKALTNYMYSLLKEIGIKSNYTLVKAGGNDKFFIPDFPSSQFNHVILSVPLEKDTMWLECTSQTLPAGYLSGFTSDRYVLAINENGGHLIKTPKYSWKENLQSRKTNAIVDEAGTLIIDAITNYKAIQQDQLHSMITGLSKEKVLEILKEEIDLPQYDVLKYEYQEFPSVLPEIKETLKLSASNYAQVSGKRLFVAPNILTKSARKLTPAESRQYDVVIDFEYTDIDTVEIKVPAGYIPEAMPAVVSLNTKFGKYTSSTRVEGDKIIYYRAIERYGGRFPAADYNELVKFLDQVYKADRTKVVLVKKEG